MTRVKLIDGPCDPRSVEMTVTADAKTIDIRPMPYDVRDVYAVIDRFIEDGDVQVATASYRYTEGARPQVEQYRKAIARIGAGRAFTVKRKKYVG